MKVILVNPPMDFEVALGKAKGIADYTVMMPMGISYIAATLLKNNIDVKIIDGYAERLSIEEMVEKITKTEPSVVGISCVTPVVPIVHTIARRIKEKDEGIKIVLGGPHPSCLTEEVLADKNIDLVVRGEGEFSLLKVIQGEFNQENLSQIKGISWRKNGQIVHNSDGEFIEELDSLPFPAHRLLPMHLYKAPPQWSIASPAFEVNASRGCPYLCGFCAVGLGRKMRLRSANNICDEIELLVRDYGCRQVVFVDSTFPISTRHADEICDEIIRRNLNKKIVWFTSTRVDIVTLDMLKKMYQAGCRLLTFGIESGNQRLLDNIKKGFTLKQIEKAVSVAKQAKIGITASYIFGLPGETYQTGLETIKFAKELDTLYAQFNLLVPYPGTDVYNYMLSRGNLNSQDWSRYISITSMTDVEPPFIPEGMTKEQLLFLQKSAYRQYYLRPKIVLRHLCRAIFNWDPNKYYQLVKVLLQTLTVKQ